MFPRGARFEPVKDSGVPGPGAYNVDTESQLDGYKRGAFLEKTDRFNDNQPEGTELPPLPPIPSSLSSSTKEPPPRQRVKSMKRTTTPLPDGRFLVLQRKLEELERLHQDSKKAHASELHRANKANRDLTERLDKQKKQIEALDAKLQDQRKASLAEHAEVKELRMRLRVSEHERQQVTQRQGDAGELKKALHSLESRRKQEIRERDERIEELEKAASREKKARDATEAKFQEALKKAESERDAAQATAKALQAERRKLEADTKAAQESAEQVREECEAREEDILEQLEQHQALVARVSEEYSRLARTKRQIEDARRHDAIFAAVQSERLQRKLANSEGQVVELAYLVRQVKTDNTMLKAQVAEAEEEISLTRQSLADAASISYTQDVAADIASTLRAVAEEEAESQRCITEIDAKTRELLHTYETTLRDETAVAYALADRETLVQSMILHIDEVDILALRKDIADIRKERDEAASKVRTTEAEVGRLVQSQAETESRLVVAEAEARAASARQLQAVTREREVTQRMNTSLQQTRQAEQGLRAKINALTAELEEAIEYKDAYEQLVEEAHVLASRNEIAEAEARQLMKANADILGHGNPSQRIVYVDKIRNELHGARQEIARLRAEREAFLNKHAALLQELDSYRSVMVPIDGRPKTHMTRVARLPLASRANEGEGESRSDGENVVDRLAH
ncbi:hypothetical protein GGF50DRAFT_102891 [Schizophyllum commune]